MWASAGTWPAAGLQDWPPQPWPRLRSGSTGSPRRRCPHACAHARAPVCPTTCVQAGLGGPGLWWIRGLEGLGAYQVRPLQPCCACLFTARTPAPIPIVWCLSQSGIFSYNGLLCGLALGTFRPSVEHWPPVLLSIAGGATSTLLVVCLGTLLAPYSCPVCHFLFPCCLAASLPRCPPALQHFLLLQPGA